MGIVVSSPVSTSPFFLTTGIIGLISFGFTLATFIKVVWENFETLTEAEHEVHTYLTNLRQELLEERASIRFMKKHYKHTRKERGTRHSKEIDSNIDVGLDQQTLRTMSDAIKHLIKTFQHIESPFLEPGEQGIQQASHRRSNKRRGEESTSPYYTHSAYNSPTYEKRPRARSRSPDDDDEFWPQRVTYSRFTWWKRMKWLRRKPSAQKLFEQLARLQTRKIARQVSGIAMVLHQYGGSLQEVDESINRIEDRLHRVVVRAIAFSGKARDQDSRLFTIPRELRDGIFDLVFTRNGSTMDLTATTPPSNAVLSTCQQAYREGRNIYKNAYRSYWGKNTFTANISRHRFPLDGLGNIRCDDLACVTHFRFKLRILGRSVTIDIVRSPDGRSWRATRKGQIPDRLFDGLAEDLSRGAQGLLNGGDAMLYPLTLGSWSDDAEES